MKRETNSIVCSSRVARQGEPRQRVRMSATLLLIALSAMSGCTDNFTPTPKVASYDPVTEKLTLPAPCPDWSQSQTQNYQNEPHSNYGCAVNNNMALQLDNPQDMNEGHGSNRPEPGITTGVIEQYRAGKIPLALTPTQTSSAPAQ